ncbi:cytochrome P450 [Gymnopus androsaceus JB14]|uniref:Cytochrome P450 n=1 Tax=Gymnopus androsaceus JB14 TaxID=1447944 RepID=A0A6A4HZJ6_9AGAR|nr:cytochrome P450 [Gymnopus androsaceus JB14]
MLYTLTIIAAMIIVYAIRQYSIHRSTLLPPGPAGLPIVGNLNDMPKEREWLTYSRWYKQYGSEIVHLKIFSQHIIVLNSAVAVKELLDKRSSNFSDRPYSLMICDLMGWKWNLGLMPYGGYWRRHRRMFHQYFYAAAAKRHYGVQQMIARGLLQRLSTKPEEFNSHLRWFAGSIILKIVYGYNVHPENDHYVELAEAADRGLIEAMNAGAFLVDTLPFLRVLPDWFPGAGFKKKAELWKKSAMELRESLFKEIQENMQEETAESSFVHDNLTKIKLSTSMPLDETDVVQNCAGVAYAGIVSTLSTFLLAMMLHPEVQAQAQAEIDAVISAHRLPDFSDEEKLPFVHCVIAETMRWQPSTPLALPHQSILEDVYKGYYIPAGSIVVGNLWGILHDENVYPEPFSFKPKRFLCKDGSVLPLPLQTFGFGRRACPGKHLALNSIWIAVISILATFDISKPVDKNGQEIEPEVVYLPGAASHPKPFQCMLTPRSQRLGKLSKLENDV